MTFKLRTILDEGLNNPILNRIYFQFAEMTKTGFFWIEEEKQRDFSQLLWNVAEESIKLEKILNKYCEIEAKTIDRINSSEGIKHQKNGFSFYDPTSELKDIFETFLIKAVVITRKYMKVCSFIREKEYKSNKTFYSDFIIDIKPGSKLYSWVKRYGDFVKKLYDLRNLSEHEELDIERFDVDIVNGEKIIKLPKLKKENIYLNDYMIKTILSLLTYLEDMTALLLITVYRGPGKIISLDESQMPNHKNFKYVIDF